MTKKFLPLLLAAVLLLGCAAQAGQADLKALYGQMEAAGLPEMIPIQAGMLLDLYGIDPEKLAQCQVYVCADGMRADEVWLLEAKDLAYARELEDLAYARIAQKDAESVTYSPEQNAVVKKSLILRRGCFVVLLTSPKADTLETLVNKALK